MSKEQKKVFEVDEFHKRGRTIAQPVRIPVQKGNNVEDDKPKPQK